MMCFLRVPYTSCLAIFLISFSLFVVDTDMVFVLRLQGRPPSEPSEARRARRLLRNRPTSQATHSPVHIPSSLLGVAAGMVFSGFIKAAHGTKKRNSRNNMSFNFPTLDEFEATVN